MQGNGQRVWNVIDIEKLQMYQRFSFICLAKMVMNCKIYYHSQGQPQNCTNSKTNIWPRSTFKLSYNPHSLYFSYKHPSPQIYLCLPHVCRNHYYHEGNTEITFQSEAIAVATFLQQLWDSVDWTKLSLQCGESTLWLSNMTILCITHFKLPKFHIYVPRIHSLFIYTCNSVL